MEAENTELLTRPDPGPRGPQPASDRSCQDSQQKHSFLSSNIDFFFFSDLEQSRHGQCDL